MRLKGFYDKATAAKYKAEREQLERTEEDVIKARRQARKLLAKGQKRFPMTGGGFLTGGPRI